MLQLLLILLPCHVVSFHTMPCNVVPGFLRSSQGKAKDGPGSVSKAVPPVDADGVEEKGAEFMDVLMDGRIMDIGEAEIAWEDIELGERVGAGTNTLWV